MKDTEAYKLARANDPQTSQISARVSMSGKRRELVYREVVNAGGYAGDTREGSRVIRDVKWEASLTAIAPKKPLERARIPKSDHYYKRPITPNQRKFPRFTEWSTTTYRHLA